MNLDLNLFLVFAAIMSLLLFILMLEKLTITKTYSFVTNGLNIYLYMEYSFCPKISVFAFWGVKRF
jgi:hypothetical protein